MKLRNKKTHELKFVTARLIIEKNKINWIGFIQKGKKSMECGPKNKFGRIKNLFKIVVKIGKI